MAVKINLTDKYFQNKISDANAAIEKVIGREILDSRGNPTIEVDVILKDGTMGRAGVPSGASTGKREALELRDKDENRYLGKGVKKAVENVAVLGDALKGMNVSDQVAIDQKMLDLDGTDNKSKYGANAILGISMACAKAAANFMKKPLFEYIYENSSYVMPIPMMNVMNGGAHAGWNTEIQEYMIMPIGASDINEAIRMGAEMYHTLKKIVKSKGYATTVGDEGGFAPAVDSNEKSLALLMEAIVAAGYKPGVDIAIALDCAASEFYKDGSYELKSENKILSSEEMIKMYSEWVEKYPIISIEDGLSEDDWDGWKKLTDAIGDKVALVGDDLFVTNKKILQEGIEKGVGNAILIKVNQIGSLSETLETIELAKANNYRYIISHRSGETCDTTISDIAAATDAGFIKTGAPARSDRVAKYNQLIRIQEVLGSNAQYKKI